MNILPSEVDKQDLNTLLWILLDNEQSKEENEALNAPIMGIF